MQISVTDFTSLLFKKDDLPVDVNMHCLLIVYFPTNNLTNLDPN